MLRRPKRNNPRGNDAYRTFCGIVRQRDGNRCQMPDCGSRSRIEVHHIRRFADTGHGRLNPDNAVCLCKACHTKITGYEHVYAPILNKIVMENKEKQKNKRK